MFTLTNLENIVLAIEKMTPTHKKNLEFYAKFFDISDILKQYPNQSSLGQQQRVAITRSLILNPEFLFLDEITSALDIVQTMKIIELIKILKNKNIGILMVTHNLDILREVADKVIFMDKGKIIEEGTKDILKSPNSNILKGFLSGKAIC